MSIYGINGKLLKVVQSLYERSEACVRVCREEGEWFRVGVGLQQGCVMSPWLFNVFMDGVMKEVREAVGMWVQPCGMQEVTLNGRWNG